MDSEDWAYSHTQDCDFLQWKETKQDQQREKGHRAKPGGNWVQASENLLPVHNFLRQWVLAVCVMGHLPEKLLGDSVRMAFSGYWPGSLPLLSICQNSRLPKRGGFRNKLFCWQNQSRQNEPLTVHCWLETLPEPSSQKPARDQSCTQVFARIAISGVC